MRTVAFLIALAALGGASASADELGGISGNIVDAKNQAPVPHATLYYYRAPYRENGENRLMTLQSNGRGSFNDVTLEPGRYVIMARLAGETEGCAIDDVIGGEVTRLRIEIGRDAIMCSGPRVHPALVDPNATADVYRI